MQQLEKKNNDEILEKANKKFMCAMRWYILIAIFYLVVSLILLMGHHQSIIVDFVKNNKPTSGLIIAFFCRFLNRMLSIHAEVDNKEKLEKFSILEAFFYPAIVFIISGFILDISLCRAGCNVIITTNPYFLLGLVLSSIGLLSRLFFIHMMIGDIKKEKQLKDSQSEEMRKKNNEDAFKQGCPITGKSDT